VGSRGVISLAVTAVALLGAVVLPRVDAALGEDAGGCPHSGDPPHRTGVAATRDSILCLLNRERAKHGLPALRRNAVLEATAQRYSEDMDRLHFFAHEAPNGSDPGERMRAAGYPVSTSLVGENLYWGAAQHAPPARAMRGWMESPGHRANVLRPQFTEVGVGVTYDGPFYVGSRRAAIYTTNFGGRLAP
jgi:uncharacterized protein YkwD